MNLNGKPTNPGELRIPISIKSRSVSTETGGFMVPEPEQVVDVLAKWVNVHGSEAWAANIAQASMPATVTIRYRTGIDETYTIVKNGLEFEIVSLDDIQERHEYIEIKVKRTGVG